MVYIIVHVETCTEFSVRILPLLLWYTDSAFHNAIYDEAVVWSLKIEASVTLDVLQKM